MSHHRVSSFAEYILSEFKIRTNPKERTFDYVGGIRKKHEEFDSAEAGTHGVIDTDFGNGIFQYKDGTLIDAPDDESPAALHLLEKNANTQRKTLTEHEKMTSLLQLNQKLETDADANAAVRKTFRFDRKAKKRRLNDAAKAGLGRGIELLTGETNDDVYMAKSAMQKACNEQAHKSERDKFKGIRASGIFDSKISTGAKRRLDVKGHDNIKRTEWCKSRPLQAKPYRIKRKELHSVAVKPPTAIKSNTQSSMTSALAALAAYGSDSSND
jgi:hypothetical protein